MTKQQRDVVFDRASELHTPVCEVMVPGVCAYTATQWHHRQLRSQGGTNEASNGCAVCALCHDHIHRNTGAAYERGWLVKSHASPLETPCLRRGEYVVLDDEGGYTPEMEVEHGDY